MAFLFEDLMVYKKAMLLAKEVLSSRKQIKNRIIIDQLCRAVLSVPLNIAEGQGRVHAREKRQFYNTSKGSLYECLPLMQLCCDLGYFNKEQFLKMYELMNEIGRMLSGLIRSVGE
jgi:four helix bundle protein